MTSDPVPPLPLNLREVEVLRLSVETMLKLDSAVLSDQEAQRMANEQIMQREGVAGVARADRLLAAARDRLPVLHSLHTALVEHEAALARFRQAD